MALRSASSARTVVAGEAHLLGDGGARGVDKYAELDLAGVEVRLELGAGLGVRAELARSVRDHAELLPPKTKWSARLGGGAKTAEAREGDGALPPACPRHTSAASASGGVWRPWLRKGAERAGESAGAFRQARKTLLI